jgi:hypothetical protein
MTFEECCQAIIAAKGPNDYAKAYARAGLGMTGEEARVQALYIRSNLATWRGEEARKVKAELDRLGQ